MFDNKSPTWLAKRFVIGVLAATLWPVAHGEGAAQTAAVGMLFDEKHSFNERAKEQKQ
jgi:hypothetical protein